MYQPQNIPQIFSDIVSNVADEMGYPIQFLHGTWQSIRARIVEQGTGTIIKDNRFPLICLVQVFEEKFKADNEYSEVSLTLLICTDSDKFGLDVNENLISKDILLLSISVLS